MLINFEEFRTRLKSLKLPVYRDVAPKDTPYPYYVYSVSSIKRLMASSRSHTNIIEYRISLFTKGTEKELIPFLDVFKNVPFEPFSANVGDENDDSVTNFNTFMDVIQDG